MAHNFYQQPGGEDQSFAAEAGLLESHGHEVTRYTMHNDTIKTMGSWTLIQKTHWNRDSYRSLRELFKAKLHEVAHFQNTFPLISPSAYYAAKAEHIPVIQSLRNFRLTCVNGLFLRDGHVCEDCLTKTFAWPGVMHACYRNNRAASGIVASMQFFHRLCKTWTEAIDLYIALTDFSRAKFIEIGIPADKIVVKPNFLSFDPGIGEGMGGYALFVGRLAEEKGIRTLLSAWDRLNADLPLKIVGDGPLNRVVEKEVQQQAKIEWLGQKPLQEVYELMGEATLLVFPSIWYETFGRVAVEAFARGTPVIASDIGAVAEVVEHGNTGLLFRPGDPLHLAEQVEWCLAHPAELARMRQSARAEFEAHYTAEKNYFQLLDIYQQAIDKASC